ESSGPLSDRSGSGSGDAGGFVRGAFAGDAGGSPGHPESGWSVRASGSGISGGPAELPAGGLRGGGGADPEPVVGAEVFRRSPDGVVGRSGVGGATGRVFGQQSGAEQSGAECSRLCDLYLRFDGPAEGSDGRAPERGPSRDPSGFRSAERGHGDVAGLVDLLRRRDVGGLGRSAQRRAAGALSREGARGPGTD